jgi:hypothetical protein
MECVIPKDRSGELESIPLDPIVLLLSPAAKRLEIEAFQPRVRPRNHQKCFPKTQFSVYAQRQQLEWLEHREISRAGMTEFQSSCFLKNPSPTSDRAWAWTDLFCDGTKNVIVVSNRRQQH